MLVTHLLEGAAERDESLVAQRPPDQLQADRQTVRRVRHRHGQRWHPEIVHRPREARHLFDGVCIRAASRIAVGDPVVPEAS